MEKSPWKKNRKYVKLKYRRRENITKGKIREENWKKEDQMGEEKKEQTCIGNTKT